MKKGVCLNQKRRIILRVVGALLAIAACCTILATAPDNGKVGVAAASAARNIAVAHMNLMRTTQCIPQNSTWYISTGTGKTDDYIKSKTYKGMPYSQTGKNEWSAMSAKLTPVYPNASLYYCSITAGFTYVSPQSFGNDCAKAVFQSWKQAGSPIGIINTWTGTMLSAVQYSSNYMQKVGSYDSSGYSTYQMTRYESQRLGVYNSYDLLQPGDSIFKHYNGGSDGHARLVYFVNPSTQTVYYYEQCGSGTDGWRLDSYFTTWQVSSASYATLFADHYVPVTANFSGW